MFFLPAKKANKISKIMILKKIMILTERLKKNK